jgi:hypothetical protein
VELARLGFQGFEREDVLEVLAGWHLDTYIDSNHVPFYENTIWVEL